MPPEFPGTTGTVPGSMVASVSAGQPTERSSARLEQVTTIYPRPVSAVSAKAVLVEGQIEKKPAALLRQPAVVDGIEPMRQDLGFVHRDCGAGKFGGKARRLCHRNELARTKYPSDGAIFAIGGSTKCLIEAEISIGALYDPLQIGDVEVEPYAVAVIDHHPHRVVRAE